MSTLLSTLRERGCIHDASHFEELEQLLERDQVTFYCGFDPTADSLHAGSMLPLLIMRRLQRKGHRPLVIVGSATGMIGDPSGKSEERKLLDEQQVEHNVRGIEAQIGLFLESGGDNGFTLLRNDSWLGALSYIDFLRDIGKLFSVNAMIAKESVRARLENREQGISYTEFSYMLLQAYDYLWLYQNHGCTLQVGGSDQWGNITAGLELIRKRAGDEAPSAYGLTFPLLTTATGAKLGKTERGAIWLSAERTSPYQFFQYWLNTADADAGRYLRLFTDIEGSELAELLRAIDEAPDERRAQRRLAEELTTLVHGRQEMERAGEASRVLFGESIKNVSRQTLQEIFSDVPSVGLARSDIEKDGIALLDLLVLAGAAGSKGAARRLVEGGGIYLNNERVTKAQAAVRIEDFIDKQILLLRSGKKSYYLVQLT